MSLEDVTDPIAEGSYAIDSHIVQYYVGPDGYLSREGCLGTNPPKPYKISYRAIVPKKSECTNLLIPVCLSASHAAFSSIRMEPQFMMLGQAAGASASIAIDENKNVQEIDYNDLQTQLLNDKAIIQ